MRAIKAIDYSKEFIERNFALNEYRDSIGRMLPMYRMTKNGFMCLVMGFRGPETNAIKERYITAFDAMAERLADGGIHVPGVTGLYLTERRKVSAAARFMRQWQDRRPVLLKRARLEQAGQKRLSL